MEKKIIRELPAKIKEIKKGESSNGEDSESDLEEEIEESDEQAFEGFVNSGGGSVRGGAVAPVLRAAEVPQAREEVVREITPERNEDEGATGARTGYTFGGGYLSRSQEPRSSSDIFARAEDRVIPRMSRGSVAPSAISRDLAGGRSEFDMKTPELERNRMEDENYRVDRGGISDVKKRKELF